MVFGLNIDRGNVKYLRSNDLQIFFLQRYFLVDTCISIDQQQIVSPTRLIPFVELSLVVVFVVANRSGRTSEQFCALLC